MYVKSEKHDLSGGEQKQLELKKNFFFFSLSKIVKLNF